MSERLDQQNEEPEKGRKPDAIAYVKSEPVDGKRYSTRVGAVWKHPEHGYQAVKFNEGISVSGTLHLHDIREDRMQGYEDERREQAMNEPERSPQRNRSRERSR